MSVAYYIVLDNDAPGFDPFVNGKALAHEENLVALCKKLGLRTLDDFVVMSQDDLSDWLEEDIDQPVGEEDQWFTADEGLEFVAALSAHIKAHPKTVKDAAGCLEDLAEYSAVLEKARLADVKWRLNLDF